MEDLASRLGISYLYITHDLAVARYMCDRIGVMYLGKIVEMGRDGGSSAKPAPSIHAGAAVRRGLYPTPPTSVRRVNIEGGVSIPVDPARALPVL